MTSFIHSNAARRSACASRSPKCVTSTATKLFKWCPTLQFEMGNKLTKEETHKDVKVKAHKVTKEKTSKIEEKESKKSAFQRFLARLQIRPNKPESSPKQPTTDIKVLTPPPKPPLRNHAEREQSKKMIEENTKSTEWIDIPLKVPDSPPTDHHYEDVKVAPIPPPRKHKVKLQDILDSPKKAVHLDLTSEKEEKRIPVVEPLIKKQKVIEHVCDGTHRHVHNVVDGKVVDTIIPIHNKDVNISKPSSKNASTLSLPSYNDLKKKDDKRASSPIKLSKKKSSNSSLPTEKKPKPHTAAERIESYMIRCKSFGSIIPHKNEKLKTIDQGSDKESLDSWSGLEDWDMGVIENDVAAEVPPVKKQSFKRKSNLEEKTPHKDRARMEYFNSVKPDTKEFDELLSAMNKSLEASPKITTTAISLAQTNTPTTDAQVSVDTVEEKAKIPSQASYPFKQNPAKSVFENDAFFTNEFIRIEREAICYTPNSGTKQAPLAAFDSDRDSEKDLNVTSPAKHRESSQIVQHKQSENTIITTTLTQSPPTRIPRRKSSSGHSKLLKFIKDTSNSSEKDYKIEKEINKNIRNTEDDKIDESKEPEIVPTIKRTGTSWDEVLERNKDIQTIDQESVISDMVETSSDDTRSTTIDITHEKH